MPTEVPEFLYDIPEDAPDEVKLHLRAQRLVQAAFYAFGDPNERPGSLSVGAAELLEVLNFATAMLTAASRATATRQDIRRETERQERFVRLAAETLRSDNTIPQLLASLGISASQPN
jgi:hypothetical protein